MKRVGYVYINDVPTRIVTWDKWIEEPFGHDEKKELILCIPGNPGVTAFYEEFLETVQRKVNIPVWIVGHSGHERSKDIDLADIPDPQKDKNKFKLTTQISNKVAFIQRYVPNDVKIHLVGHSVGTYSILHLLDYPEIKKKVIKSYFLFPTIEYLGDSYFGTVMKTIKPFVPSIIFCAWIFTVLPRFVQILGVYIYCLVTGTALHQLKPIINFVDPYVVANVFTMAYDQISEIRERPNEKLKENLENIKMYYGEIDNWIPPSVHDNIKKDHPELDMMICQRGMHHSFVLWKPKEMGEIVAEWLLSD